MAVTVQSKLSGLIFLTFTLNSMPEGHPSVHFVPVQPPPAFTDSHAMFTRYGRRNRTARGH